MSADTDTTEQRWLYMREPSTVTVDGIETAYRREGSGEQLVFLHGAGFTRRWLPFYDRLAERYDTIVPDHPGFGDTPFPAWLEGMDDVVLHYDALLRELNIERPHLVGHSLGGWIAGSLALTYPERFASLTLISPIGLMVPEAPLSDPFRWLPEEALDRLFSGAGEKYVELFDEGDPIEQRVHAYIEATTLARLFWNPRYDHRLERRLGRIATPTLVLQPGDDNFVPMLHAERWAAAIPGAQLQVIDGAGGEPAGHVIVLQQPERVAELIAAHAG